MMTTFKTFLLTVIVLVIVLLLFVYSGIYNIAADKPHLPLTRSLLETTRSRSVALRADDVRVPDDLAGADRVQRGAERYSTMCQVCHLGPGIKPTPMHEGLNPKPPELARHLGDRSPDKLFWIVKHGIKMTGMPAWGESHGDEELWDIVAFVAKLPEMKPEQYNELTAPAGARHGSGH